MRDKELGNLVLKRIDEKPIFSTISQGLSVFEDLYKDLNRDEDTYPDDDDELTIAGAIFRDIAGTTYEEFCKILWIDIIAPDSVEKLYSIDERMRVVSLRAHEKENTETFAKEIAIKRKQLKFTAINAIQQLKDAIKKNKRSKSRVCYYAIFINKNSEREAFIRGHQWYKNGKIAIISKVRQNNSDNWYIHHKDLDDLDPIQDQPGFTETIDLIKRYNKKINFYLAIDYSDSQSKDEENVQLWAAFTSVCDLATISLLEYFRDEIQNVYLRPILDKYGLYGIEKFLNTLSSNYEHDDYDYSKKNNNKYESIKKCFQEFINHNNTSEITEFLTNESGLDLNYENIILSLRELYLFEQYGSISTLFVILVLLSIGEEDKISQDSYKTINKNQSHFAKNKIIPQQSKERLLETILSMTKMFSRIFYDKDSRESSIKRIDISIEGVINITLDINPVDKTKKRNLFSTINNILEENCSLKSTIDNRTRDNRTASRSIVNFWLRSSLEQKSEYDIHYQPFQSTFSLKGAVEDKKEVLILTIGKEVSSDKDRKSINNISHTILNITIYDSYEPRRSNLANIIKDAIPQSTTSKQVLFCHINDAEYIFNQKIEEDSYTFIWYTGGSPKGKEEDLKGVGFETPLHLIIQQQLSSEDVKKLPKQDIEELLNYAMTPQDLRGEKPKLLRSDPETLPALSILCQGYLAVHADSDDNDVKKALDKMNWGSLTLDILSKKEIVKDTDWWLKIFDKSIEDIIEEIKKEWNGEISNDVYGLLENLKTSTIDEASIVAKAYIAIAERLDKE